jgi:hypothetical protein
VPEALLVVFKGRTKYGPWEPVKPEDVPDWVKDETHMTHLMSGEYLQADDGTDEAEWYRVGSV